MNKVSNVRFSKVTGDMDIELESWGFASFYAGAMHKGIHIQDITKEDCQLMIEKLEQRIEELEIQEAQAEVKADQLKELQRVN